MPDTKIELGDYVKDTVTPFKGIVVVIITWISGCDRVTVQSKGLKDGIPQESYNLDITQVTLIKKASKPKPVKKAVKKGGPQKDVGKLGVSEHVVRRTSLRTRLERY